MSLVGRCRIRWHLIAKAQAQLESVPNAIASFVTFNFSTATTRVMARLLCLDFRYVNFTIPSIINCVENSRWPT